jgi:hypothetical protein
MTLHQNRESSSTNQKCMQVSFSILQIWWKWIQGGHYGCNQAAISYFKQFLSKSDNSNFNVVLIFFNINILTLKSESSDLIERLWSIQLHPVIDMGCTWSISKYDSTCYGKLIFLLNEKLNNKITILHFILIIWVMDRIVIIYITKILKYSR